MKNSCLHVLIIPSWYPSNSEDISGSFFREQAIALAKQGIRVGVISTQLRSVKKWKEIFFGSYGVKKENDESVITYRFFQVNWFPRMNAVKRFFTMYIGRSLFKEYVKKHGKPDIIHVHSVFDAGFIAAELYKRLGIPYIITEHSTAYARGLITDKEKKQAEHVVHNAKKRLAVSNEFASLLDNFFGLEANQRWSYLPNMVQQEFLMDELSDQIVDTNEYIFSTISILTPKKNVESLMRAFCLVQKEMTNTKLLIGGDGPERVKLFALTEHLGLKDKVTFLGALSRKEVKETIKRSNCFVLSSQYETFGVVLVESLALGKPVVATKCGGPESIVSEVDNTGLLVPCGDVKKLATAMLSVAHASCYDAYKIREYCRNNFGEENVSRRLIAIYFEVMEKYQREEGIENE